VPDVASTSFEGDSVKSSEIRSRFLAYFQGKGHTVVPSSSLLPHDDPTLYFVNAGMVQFKDIFTGREVRDYRRATSVQKCMRVSGKQNDLENVGRTARHHTFFEMLGNFSFGDYFKTDAVAMAWELLTGEFAIDPKRLWVTVFEDDDEAIDIWLSNGVRSDRIQRLGAKDNFWSMGDTGPCGPCSEIHYDHGPSISSEEGGPATGDDRYVEIWNLVFMQFEQSADGTRVPLPKPSIDTGAGLERVAAVLQGVYSNYDTDAFRSLIGRASTEARIAYGHSADEDVAMRVIADHARATSFLVADGVMPSNDGRGYVLRRILRRAIRFGVKLGFDRPFMHQISDEVSRSFGDAYPELRSRKQFIQEIIQAEEERFRRTLDRGMKLLDTELARVGRGGTIPGDVAFTLSDTYGFPLDLTQLIAAERGVSVDEPGYDTALKAQKTRGRLAWKGSGEKAVAELWHKLEALVGATDFTGYEGHETEGRVVAIVKVHDGEYETVERLDAGDEGIVVLDRTPFYGESGGQVGDVGTLASESAAAEVHDTGKAVGLHLHRVKVSVGSLEVGDLLQARVDVDRRARTRRNHTATHLLHAALRGVLGEHVTQKGSLVGPERLRFDFSHHKPVVQAEVAEIERRVNAAILLNRDVHTEVEDLEAAKAHGAMALFGEKYDSRVRVVSVPGLSVELCGGTHVSRTGDIGLLRIVSEGGIAAGVRRIEAQTGDGAHAWLSSQLDALNRAAEKVRAPPEQLADTIARMQDERKGLERELTAARSELARLAAVNLISSAQDMGGVKVLVAEFEGDLKEQADRLRDQLGSSVVVLASRQNGRVSLLAAASRDVAGRVPAGKIIQEIAPLIGGKGGGRPEMAQAGGTDTSGVPSALKRASAFVGEMLASG
jgi:alanyl-tRNA synthetase